MNYFLDDKINSAKILFPGVGCFLVAVCLGSAVHSSNAADNAAKLEKLTDNGKDGTGYTSSSSVFLFHCTCHFQKYSDSLFCREMAVSDYKATDSYTGT